MSGRTRSDSRARTRCRNKQRIARCHAVTGADERVRRLAEPLLHEHARCVWRQRLWTQHRRVGFQHQLGERPSPSLCSPVRRVMARTIGKPSSRFAR